MSSLGNNLVEITAVATLLGGTTAASLMLGNKSAAGMPWACMSIFGAPEIARSALSACLTDWLREAVGLRTSEVDAAIGVQLPSNAGRRSRRLEENGAIAIRTHSFRPFVFRREKSLSEKDMLPSAKISPEALEKSRPEVVFCEDGITKALMHALPQDRENRELRISIHYASSAYQDNTRKRVDLIYTGVSVSKLFESVILWYMGSKIIWWATSMSWAVAFSGSIALQLLRISREDFQHATSAYLLGTFPTSLRSGGQPHAVLQMVGNVRRHYMWRVVWGFNTFAILLTSFTLFFALNGEPSKVIYVWLAFQTGWAVTRMGVHHFAESNTTRFLLTTQSWKEAMPNTRRQCLDLLLALSNFHMTVHPRGSRAYRNDVVSISRIEQLFASCNWKFTHVFNPTMGHPVKIEAVIGDTVFRTISWSRGTQLIETYDCAILFVSHSNTLLAIPCVRVYDCNFPHSDIPLSKRGVAHVETCSFSEWIIWFPTTVSQDGKIQEWAFVHGGSIQECMNVERLDPRAFDQMLAKGEVWNISIRSEQEVNGVIGVCRTMAQDVMHTFMDIQ